MGIFSLSKLAFYKNPADALMHSYFPPLRSYASSFATQDNLHDFRR